MTGRDISWLMTGALGTLVVAMANRGMWWGAALYLVLAYVSFRAALERP